jgi:hypothetical protein
VPCETKEGKKIAVRAALLHQSKTFETMWKVLNDEQLKDFVFPVKAVSSEIFNKVVDWLKEHVGKLVLNIIYCIKNKIILNRQANSCGGRRSEHS